MVAVFNYLSRKYCDLFECFCNRACVIDGKCGVAFSCGAVSEAQWTRLIAILELTPEKSKSLISRGFELHDLG